MRLFLAAGAALILLAGCITPTAAPSPSPTPSLTPTATPAPTSTPTPTATPTPAPVVYEAGALPWWNDRVFYEIFVRSFYDSGDDGVGDLQGVIEKLDYLNDGDPSTTADLGVTGIWLMPITESPSYHGYDVKDYYSVERDYGTLDDLRRLLDEAHSRGIAVIIDLVLNHTALDHPWFVSAVHEPDGPYGDWYIFQDEDPGYNGPWGQQVWYPSGDRYYYAVFWSGMPDLNYRNPEVTGQMYDVTRFWLEDVGVDGFRLDAIKHFIENDAVQENTRETLSWLYGYNNYINSLNPDAFTVGEVWSPMAQVVDYTGARVDVAFEFDLASAFIQAAERGRSWVALSTLVEAYSTYPEAQFATFLANHDMVRTLTQLGGDVGAARVAATMQLTAPGVPFIYYGEEIGMLGGKPDERIRTPMQWAGDIKVGFSTAWPWNGVSSGYQTYNVAAETDDPDSLLSHYRSLIRLRNDIAALRQGALYPLSCSDNHVYTILRYLEGEAVLVIANLSREAVSDYTLTLEAGPLTGISEAALLMGEGDLTLPALSAGGFVDYTPIPELPPQSSFIIHLTLDE
jgi:glycosidase